MEVLGAVAGAAQISGSVLSIISTIQEVRHQISEAPLQSEDRIKYLDLLCSTIRKVEGHFDLHTDEVAGYLAVIRTKILRLQSIITKQLSKLQSSTYRKVRFAFTVLKVEKRISESFAALHSDCSNLNLYLSASEKTRAPATAQLSKVKMEDDNKSNKPNSSVKREPAKGAVPAKESTKKASESGRGVKQTFAPMTAKGAGSMNRLGNTVGVSGELTEQDFQTANAEDGAVNDAGNHDYTQGKDTDGKKRCEVS